MSSLAQSRSDSTPTIEPRSARKVLPSQNFCHGSDFTGQIRLPLDFETAYHQAMAPIAARWDARAKSHPETAGYSTQRARAIRFRPADRMATCERRHLTIKCGCRHVRIPVSCGLRWLCDKCRRRTYSRFFKRARRAMREHERIGRRAWVAAGSPLGDEPRWLLITLTVRHSGDLAADRARIIKGWKRFRQWVWKQMGRFAFGMSWELTEGSDGLGHLHAHVSALWRYVDWKEARKEWKRAMCDEGAVIHFRTATKGAGGAAAYIAKYASKGVELSAMSPLLGARAIAANYGKRLINASQGFWMPRDPTCRTCHRRFLVHKYPKPLRDVSPFGAWDALARGHGVDSWRAACPQRE